MSVSAPRLPRLGGHQPTPMRNSSMVQPSTSHSAAPSSCVDPANVSHPADRMNRLHIDVGYDEDGVPLASQGSGSLSGGGASDTGAVPLHQPRPSSKPVAARPSSSALTDSWKASMRDEVLQGKALRLSSPDTAAAVPRDDLYSTLAEEDDIEVVYAEEDSAQAREVSDSSGGVTHPAHRYPVMVPESGLAKIATPPVPVLNAPASPVSLSSSIATDTPRSILRQSGTASSKTFRSSSRRISFVGISPPRPDEHRGRRSGDEESGNDSDEYESAEPSLHYDRETPSAFVTATPPRHARKVHSGEAYSSNSHHDSHQSSGGGSNRASSPLPAPQQTRASSSPSLKSPRLSSRSPTHSPPRDSAGRYTSPVGPSLSTAVTAPSAPPPPEEGDEITLDVAPQHRPRAPPHLLRRPEQDGDQRRARSPSMGANGREEDVLTQPHHRSETGGVPVTAATVMRCPPRRHRWPSDAYQDDPPTEANDTQRTRRYRRESLDPEDDMCSSSHTYSSSTGSDGSFSLPDASPLKMHQKKRQEASYRATSPPLPTSSPHPIPPIHLPLRQSSANASEHRDGTSSGSSHNSGSRRSPEETGEPNRGGTSHEQHHGHYSSRVETRPGQLTETNTSEATPHHRSNGMRGGGEKQGQDSHASDGAPPPRREASYAPSAGYSPSTITDYSPGQSMADDLSVSTSAVAGQEARRASFLPLKKHLYNNDTRARPPKSCQQQLELVPPAASASTAEAPAKLAKKMKAATASIADEPQVYVDPLSSERRHHPEQHSLSAGATRGSPYAEELQLHQRHSGLHALRRGPEQRQLTTSEPVSLRDVMMLHDSPAAKSQRGTLSSQSATAVILRLPSRARQLQSQHGGAGDNDAAHALTSRAADMEASVASSSPLSSGGVPADELVWDAPTPASRTGSGASPPVSPRSSVAPAPHTPGGHKVFRKKLVVVVRRKKRGAAPSEDDPVVQMSLVPFKEGAAALVKSNPSLQGSSQQRHARSEGVSAAETAPTLVKLIDHVERGWSASVSSRCTSPASHQEQMASEMAQRCDGSDDHTGADEIRKEIRRRFRRALSALSSRNVSPRASVSPSSTQTTVRPNSSRSRSPRSRNDASDDAVRPRCGTVSVGEEAESHNGNSARRRSSGRRHGSQAVVVNKKKSVRMGATSLSPWRSSRGSSRHSDEESRHRANGERHHSGRRRHKHEDSTHDYVEHRQRSLSAAAMPGAPYRATQNDEYYGAADMAKDVAALIPLPLQERIGITPMPMQLLPRLVLQSELGLPPKQQYSHHPRSNIDAGQHSSGAWSTSDDEDEHNVGRITEGSSGGRRSRSLRLQVGNGTRTAREAGESLACGNTRSGMPLLAATPVQRIPPVGPIKGTCDSEHLDKVVDASERAATLPPADDAFVIESPASFAYRSAPPTAAIRPVRSLISRIRGSSSSSVASGGNEAGVFGGDAGASRKAPAALPLSVGSAHMAATHPQRATPHPGTATYATMDATTSVPLFVPPLTVDNVSQLSHDWQSTLRERSSKAKRDAMEKFLIASAEASAACAAAAVDAQAPCDKQQQAKATQAHQGLTLEKPRRRSAASAAVSNVLRYPQLGSPSFWEIERDVRQRSSSSSSAAQSAPMQQRAAKDTALPAPLKTESVRVATSVPADSASRSGTAPIECKGNVGECPKAASKHSCTRNRWPLPGPRRSKSNGHPLTGSFDVETPSTGVANSPDKCTNGAAKGSKADEGTDVVDIVVQSLPTVSLSTSPAPVEEEQQVRQDNSTACSSDRRRSRSPRGKAAVRKEAVQTGTNGASAGSARQSPPFFFIVEPITEAQGQGSAEKAAQQRDGNRHRRDERGKHSNRHSTNASSHRSPSPSSSEASRSKCSRQKKSKRGKKARNEYDNKQRKRKHSHEPHARSRVRLRSTRSGDATLFGMDEESDLDSDLTTSMEFQLSRLLLLREAAALTGQTPSSVAEASKRGKHTEDKADRKAASKAAAAKKNKHDRHRSHSSKAKKAKTRSKRAATRRGASSAGTTGSSPSDPAEKKKRERHRAASPSKPAPLPPPPTPQRSRVLHGDEAAANSAVAGSATDPIFAPIAPRSKSDSRYHRSDYAASASPRVTFEDNIHSCFRYRSAKPYFREGSVYSGGQSDDAEAAPARYRAAARTGSDSGAPYQRYRRHSQDTSPLRGLRPYAASATSRWSSAFRQACRPASRYAAALEDPPFWHRSYSNPGRPSTRWNDYVQEAERDAAGRPSSSPYTYAHHSHGPAQPTSRTYSDTYTSRRRQANLFDDVDDIPIRQYFNDNGQGNADEHGSGARYDSTSAFRHRRSRSDASNPAPPGNYERSRAAAEKNRALEDDFLVSTPLHEGTEDLVGSHPSPRARTRTTRRPPPPSPPPASTSASVAETGSLFAAISRSGALPIVKEHTVTDAQTAEDFVRGVKEVISALQQYRISV